MGAWRFEIWQGIPARATRLGAAAIPGENHVKAGVFFLFLFYSY